MPQLLLTRRKGPCSVYIYIRVGIFGLYRDYIIAPIMEHQMAKKMANAMGIYIYIVVHKGPKGPCRYSDWYMCLALSGFHITTLGALACTTQLHEPGT